MSSTVLHVFVCAALFAVTVVSEICPVVLPNPPPSGNPTLQNSSSTALTTSERIVNGRNALPATRQHLVAIVRTVYGQEQQYCTGSLISPLWVLTAAHCKVTTQDTVRLGGLNWEDGEKRSIIYAKSHSTFGREFIPGREILDDDIAVLKLSAPAPSNMVPLLINDNIDVPDAPGYARVAGYGVTGSGADGTGGIARSVDVPVKSSARCALLFAGTASEGASTGFRIKDKLQFCAAYKDGGCDSCQGGK